MLSSVLEPIALASAERRARVEAIGTLMGTVPAGETLAGWEIVATGDGGAITMKNGSCWGRYGGWEGDAATGWDAVTARLWGRMTDEEIGTRLGETRAEIAAARRIPNRLKLVGAQAAYEATYAEAAKRGLV